MPLLTCIHRLESELLPACRLPCRCRMQTIALRYMYIIYSNNTSLLYGAEIYLHVAGTTRLHIARSSYGYGTVVYGS